MFKSKLHNKIKKKIQIATTTKKFCLATILIFLITVSIASAKLSNNTITIDGVSIYDYGTTNNITGSQYNREQLKVNNFTTSDQTIFFWYNLNSHKIGNKLTLKLYSPNGLLYYEIPDINLDIYYSQILPDPNFPRNINYYPYFGFDVKNMRNKPGKWTIEAYINDKKALTHHFYLSGEPSPQNPIHSPIAGIILALLPLSCTIFKISRNRQKSFKVSRIEAWKIYGVMFVYIIALLLALILFFVFISLLKEKGLGYVEAPIFLAISLFSASFCVTASKTLKGLLGYRKELSKNLLYLNIALPVSLALFLLFSEFDFEQGGIVIPLLFMIAPLASLYITKKHGDVLIVKGEEIKISTTSTFPAELKQHYSESEYIGAGGFAWVFRATRDDGTKVAIKIPAINDEKTGKFFIREVANWSALQHENIVKLNSFNIYPLPYLEMELCDGSLELGKRSVGGAASIIYEVGKGLKHAHERKIVHGDIKHGNILIKDGKMKISDWGLSRVKRGKSLSVAALTPEFAAPEQIVGRIDERTDIWQLGVVFYELVTGKFPFEGEYTEVINKILNDEPVLPSEINPDAKPVEHIIMKCLKKKKEERYQSIGELIEELEDYKPEDKTTLIHEKDEAQDTVEFH